MRANKRLRCWIFFLFFCCCCCLRLLMLNKVRAAAVAAAEPRGSVSLCTLIKAATLPGPLLALPSILPSSRRRGRKKGMCGGVHVHVHARSHARTRAPTYRGGIIELASGESGSREHGARAFPSFDVSPSVFHEFSWNSARSREKGGKNWRGRGDI